MRHLQRHAEIRDYEMLSNSLLHAIVYDDDDAFMRLVNPTNCDNPSTLPWAHRNTLHALSETVTLLQCCLFYGNIRLARLGFSMCRLVNPRVLFVTVCASHTKDLTLAYTIPRDDFPCTIHDTAVLAPFLMLLFKAPEQALELAPIIERYHSVTGWPEIIRPHARSTARSGRSSSRRSRR
jgi:hypothetical protein